MNDTLANQLAQVCNNLYCILRQVREYRFRLATDKKLYVVYIKLDEQYHTLFKLIYGNDPS